MAAVGQVAPHSGLLPKRGTGVRGFLRRALTRATTKKKLLASIFLRITPGWPSCINANTLDLSKHTSSRAYWR